MILLGRGEQAKPCKAPAEEVSPIIRRLVVNIGPGFAYLLGRRWDYLAWNKSFERVFSWEPGPEALSRNHVWLWFMDPSRRSLCSGDWGGQRTPDGGQVPRRPASNIGDPAFEELISALSSSSPEFRKLWKRHEVAAAARAARSSATPLWVSSCSTTPSSVMATRGDQRLIGTRPRASTTRPPSCRRRSRMSLG